MIAKILLYPLVDPAFSFILFTWQLHAAINSRDAPGFWKKAKWRVK